MALERLTGLYYHVISEQAFQKNELSALHSKLGRKNELIKDQDMQ
jgi:hypothetical protein